MLISPETFGEQSTGRTYLSALVCVLVTDAVWSSELHPSVPRGSWALAQGLLEEYVVKNCGSSVSRHSLQV